MTEWNLSFDDVGKVYERLKARQMMRPGNEIAVGRIMYIGAVGLAIRRSGKQLVLEQLFDYAAEWFKMPLSDLLDSFTAAGIADPAAFWEWLTKPERKDN